MRGTTLGDLLDRIEPGFASGHDLSVGTVQLRMNNVLTDGSLDWSSLRRVPTDAAKLARYTLRPNDVVFNSTNSPELVGKATLFTGFKEPVVFSNHFFRLRAKEDALYPSYLARWLNFNWGQRLFEHLSTRWVNQAAVRKDDLADLRVELPKLTDQRRIIAILDRAERLRRMQRYAVDIATALLPSAFLALFGDPATNPHEYPLTKGDTLFSPEREGVKCGPFGSALRKADYVPAGIPVWTMDNIVDGSFHEEGCLFVTPDKASELEAYAVRNGDILISRAGTVGKMAVLQTRHGRSIISTNLIRLSLNETKVLPVFFATLMNHFADRIGRLKRGQEDAYTFMSTGTLSELVLPLPPLEAQQQFATIAHRRGALGNQVRESLHQADHLFQSLLHRAFTVGL